MIYSAMHTKVSTLLKNAPTDITLIQILNIRDALILNISGGTDSRLFRMISADSETDGLFF